MKCDTAQQNMVLAGYGELHDEQIDGLEEHLAQCASCRREWQELKTFEETMALRPMLEPSPNLLAQARLKLDEELDLIPAHGVLTRIRSLFFGTLATMQGAPALTTLLLGVGFLGGNFTHRFQVAHAPKPPRPVVLMDPTNGVIANVSGIVQTPDSQIVQVKYNRVVPETIEGSLDDPEIRRLLLMGLTSGTTSGVRLAWYLVHVPAEMLGPGLPVADAPVHHHLHRLAILGHLPGVTADVLHGQQRQPGCHQGFLEGA